MGHYLTANLCRASVNKTLRSYCKVRHLMGLLREYHRLAGAPLRLDLHRSSALSPRRPSRLMRKPHFRRLHNSDKSSAPYFLCVRFYSSSKRSAVKAEAPIGIFDEAPGSTSNLSSLGGYFGQSFNRLARHINLYFKRKHFVPQAERPCLLAATPDFLVRSQRCSQSQPAAGELKMWEDKNGKESLETSPPTQGSFGLQLFHLSSLATAFGESYDYVANHINSVFSRHLAKFSMQGDLGQMSTTRVARRRRKRQTQSGTYIISSKDDDTPQVKAGAERAGVDSNVSPSSWDEGYLHFARHINKYFGAKVTDGVDEGRSRTAQHPEGKNGVYEKHFSMPSISQTPGAASHQKQGKAAAPEYGGLFHSSSYTTNFGGNHSQMAGHINQYFKGQRGPDEDGGELDSGSATAEKTVSFMDCLLHPTSAIPHLLGSYLKLGSLTPSGKPTRVVTSPEAVFNKKFVLSHREAEEMTLGLIGGLARASSPEALTSCMEALNEHLISYPSCRALMWQEKTAVTLLRKRQTNRENQALQGALRETLSLIGYIDPVKGRGIRVLSIDGGGTRGVVPLQMLKLLEAETGKKIHQLFDYVCGVSTGAVLAFMLGLVHFSLEECADMYRRFGSEVFRQNPLVGTVKMGWSHSYYNTETWEKILQEKLGHKLLIKTARDESSPKVSAVSTVVNWGTSPKAFVFRNYNHKPGSLSRYAGGSGFQLWQAVRASSAAPGYFQEFPLQSDIHQDGGIIMNNPCALAVHESRLLWPNEPFQCVLSLGTGRYDNAKRAPVTSTSLIAKISNLISSATDTEGVHTLLDDLLARDVYFRFNPMLSAVVSLDECRPRAMDQLEADTRNYLERNRPKLARLCLVLGAERTAVSRGKDWMSERAWVMRQRWE